MQILWGGKGTCDWSWTGTSPQRQTCSFHELRASGPNFWMEHNGATKFSGKVSLSETLSAHPLYMIFLPKSFTWCAKSCHSVRWQERNQVGNLGRLSFQKWRFLDISCLCCLCVFSTLSLRDCKPFPQEAKLFRNFVAARGQLDRCNGLAGIKCDS